MWRNDCCMCRILLLSLHFENHVDNSVGPQLEENGQDERKVLTQHIRHSLTVSTICSPLFRTDNAAYSLSRSLGTQECVDT